MVLNKQLKEISVEMVDFRSGEIITLGKINPSTLSSIRQGVDNVLYFSTVRLWIERSPVSFTVCATVHAMLGSSLENRVVSNGDTFRYNI